MTMMTLSKSKLLAPLLSSIALLVSCNDPVRDQQIKALGGEVGTPGEEHRPGQPCLLCHSEGGPASDKPFAVAGTIYETSAPGSNGAEGVKVMFVDASGSGPYDSPLTNSAGNFFVRKDEWRDLELGFFVQIIPKGGGKPIKMATTVNREGSCNHCHAPFPTGELTNADRDRARSSVGQIFVSAAAAPSSPPAKGDGGPP